MRIAISGYGAIGKLLETKINHLENYQLVGVVDPLGNGTALTFDEINEVPDVIIDFSHPNVLESLLIYGEENNVPLVIATTGFSSNDIEKIQNTSNHIPILHTSNTSYGVNVLLEAVKALTLKLGSDYDIEVIEKHHNQKVDAPSGTAKMIVDEITSVHDNETLVYGREGSSKRVKGEIGMHAVRGGTIAGEHTVIYAGDDEIIEIKHTALSKNVFVNGALKAATFIQKQEKGLYKMSDVLKGELQ